jgi:hypothetical protein
MTGSGLMPLHRSGVTLLSAFTGELCFDVWLTAPCRCHLFDDLGRVAVRRWSALECCGDASTHFRRDRRTFPVARLALPVMPRVALGVHRREIGRVVIFRVLIFVMHMSRMPQCGNHLFAVSTRPRPFMSECLEKCITSRFCLTDCNAPMGLEFRTSPE